MNTAKNALIAVLIALPSFAYAKPLGALSEQLPVQISSVPKGFDLLAVDSQKHRLLAAHTKAGMLSVIVSGATQAVPGPNLATKYDEGSP